MDGLQLDQQMTGAEVTKGVSAIKRSNVQGHEMGLITGKLEGKKPDELPLNGAVRQCRRF